MHLRKNVVKCIYGEIMSIISYFITIFTLENFIYTFCYASGLFIIQIIQLIYTEVLTLLKHGLYCPSSKKGKIFVYKAFFFLTTYLLKY